MAAFSISRSYLSLYDDRKAILTEGQNDLVCIFFLFYSYDKYLLYNTLRRAKLDCRCLDPPDVPFDHRNTRRKTRYTHTPTCPLWKYEPRTRIYEQRSCKATGCWLMFAGLSIDLLLMNLLIVIYLVYFRFRRLKLRQVPRPFLPKILILHEKMFANLSAAIFNLFGFRPNFRESRRGRSNFQIRRESFDGVSPSRSGLLRKFDK